MTLNLAASFHFTPFNRWFKIRMAEPLPKPPDLSQESSFLL